VIGSRAGEQDRSTDSLNEGDAATELQHSQMQLNAGWFFIQTSAFLMT
jgi:hypothetical protein